MALVTEDGSIVAGAEAYIDVSYADTYHANMGNAAWSALTLVQKEVAIRRATMYLTEAYRLQWAGRRYSPNQVLDWPRTLVPKKDTAGFYVSGQVYYDYRSIPDEVKKASAEMALRSLSGDLMPDLKQAVRSKKVGPIETVYDPYSPQQRRYKAVTALLAPLLKSGGSGVMVGVSRS